MKDFLFTHNSWFDKAYQDKLHSRFATMKIAIGWMLQHGGKYIVETGCERSENGVPDWGGGCSTSVFQAVVNRYDGELLSIDNNMVHINRAKSMVGEDPRVKFLHADSAVGLARVNRPIDLLYLDSWDYPIFEVTDLFGGRAMYETAVQIVNAMTEDEFLSQFGHIVGACQQHCLKEVQAVLPSIHENTVILIDDCKLAGGGKGRIARDWMSGMGWTLIYDSYQTLWIRGK